MLQDALFKRLTLPHTPYPLPSPLPLPVPVPVGTLTWLLKDALFGNAKTTLLAALSPADVNYEETMSTLRFCLTAKQIKTSAIVNIDETEKLLAEMRGEIDNLKAHLEAAARAGSMLQQQYLSGE